MKAWVLRLEGGLSWPEIQQRTMNVLGETAGDEAVLAARLGVVRPADEPHELGHHVTVVVRRAEGVLGAHPARREDDKVGDGDAGLVGGGAAESSRGSAAHVGELCKGNE